MLNLAETHLRRPAGSYSTVVAHVSPPGHGAGPLTAQLIPLNYKEYDLKTYEDLHIVPLI